VAISREYSLGGHWRWLGRMLPAKSSRLRDGNCQKLNRPRPSLRAFSHSPALDEGISSKLTRMSYRSTLCSGGGACAPFAPTRFLDVNEYPNKFRRGISALAFVDTKKLFSSTTHFRFSGGKVRAVPSSPWHTRNPPHRGKKTVDADYARRILEEAQFFS